MCSIASTPTACPMRLPPVPPASRARYACVLQSGRRLLSSPSETGELVETVERRRLVALGERRIVENRVDEVVDRGAQREHGLADVNQLRGPFTDDVNAEQGPGLAVEDDLQPARRVAADLPRAISR